MDDITDSNVDNDISSIQIKYYNNNYQTRLIKANEVVLPCYYKKLGQCIEDMEVRDDDIWVCSFMKTVSLSETDGFNLNNGLTDCERAKQYLKQRITTHSIIDDKIVYLKYDDEKSEKEDLSLIPRTTWCQEMTWCIANDLDFNSAKQNLVERFPFLESSTLQVYGQAILDKPDIKIPKYMSNSVEFINGLKSPRYIKTHLPYKLLPKKLRNQSTKAKIIYMARNAKDTCLSYFHHSILFGEYKGNFEEFCKMFSSDSVCYSPFFDHILGYWNRRNDSQVLFLKYEDMKQDLRSVIRQTAQFLGKDILEDQLLVLEDHLSFESMKKNKAVNNELFLIGKGSFLRSGIVGEGKTKMTPELVKLFDEWEEKCLKNSGLKFF